MVVVFIFAGPTQISADKRKSSSVNFGQFASDHVRFLKVSRMLWLSAPKQKITL